MRTARLLLPLWLAASAQAAHHEVTVGKGGELKFDPEVLRAEVGDIVQYTFFSKNHSVVESSFSAPCEPLKGGFFSGFIATESKDTAAGTTFSIVVDTKDPQWVYCSQGNHCQKGMAHVINPPEKDNTLEAYKKAAAKVDKSTSPRGGAPLNGVRRATVEVGKGGKLEFSPSTINEPKGSYVEFVFHPKNHSVVQSSFKEPCVPNAGGFSSGFIPVVNSPSGASFEVEITDDDPLWFYCGQGNHCQSGMVGVINPAGNGDETLEAYAAAAKAAKKSTIPADAPLEGVVFVNGTIVTDFEGNVMPEGIDDDPYDSDDDYDYGDDEEDDDDAPPPPLATPTATRKYQPAASHSLLPSNLAEAPQYFRNRAGGGKPENYNWASALTPSASEFLQVHSRIEDLLLHLLWSATLKLEPNGTWAKIYPEPIVHTIGAWAAQSLIHRATTAEVLLHYKQPVPSSCEYKLPLKNVDEFLEALAEINSAAIGSLIDISMQVADADPFLIPLLMTEVGAKSRAAGVVNMMQDHMASVAPREVALPTELAWSFVKEKYVESCPEEVKGMPEAAWPALTVGEEDLIEMDGWVVRVQLHYDGGSGGEEYVAWLGPYGMLEFSQVVDEGGKKFATVPTNGWFGDVWIAVVSKKDLVLSELDDYMVAGPAMIWLTEP